MQHRDGIGESGVVPVLRTPLMMCIASSTPVDNAMFSAVAVEFGDGISERSRIERCLVALQGQRTVHVRSGPLSYSTVADDRHAPYRAVRRSAGSSETAFCGSDRRSYGEMRGLRAEAVASINSLRVCGVLPQHSFRWLEKKPGLRTKSRRQPLNIAERHIPATALHG
jgi:hypothetical protein